ncbi:hypothetical protein HFO93_19915 [Rhizobium leguminosarum]|uniref:hypothetical protein n=1 Tax=Rhizobium leguminosarum TaxID=384 RepID=UPI001C96BCF8|nr:hypothetical protein [Rhizobium leguminosarum]MBY5445706.1 hypothetical protein [Rhizobium leguminosarum]
MKIRDLGITRSDLVANAVFCLDLTAFNGRGNLRRPVKDLLKVILHRLGVQLSFQENDGRWRVKANKRGGRKPLMESKVWFDTQEEAEIEFLRMTFRLLPPNAKAALERCG